MSRGIDISIWNGDINWNKVVKENIDFVMIRSSYGDGSSEFINNGYDRNFEKNYSAAKSVGLKIGVYHYSYARSIEEAKKEANFFIETIKDKKFEYPVVLDIEDEKTQGHLRGKKLTDIAEIFLETVESSGYYVSIYSSRYWLENYLDTDRLSRFDIWLAEWTSNPLYKGKYGLWQYSSTGRVNGIIGNVDLNKSFKDYSKIMKNNGLNGYHKEIIDDDKTDLIIYSNIKDKQAADILSYHMKLPVYFNDGYNSFIENYNNLIHIGVNKTNYKNIKKIIYGENRLETISKVINMIKQL